MVGTGKGNSWITLTLANLSQIVVPFSGKKLRKKRLDEIYLRHAKFQLSYPSGKSLGESSLLGSSADSVKKVAVFARVEG